MKKKRGRRTRKPTVELDVTEQGFRNIFHPGPKQRADSMAVAKAIARRQRKAHKGS